MGYTKVSLSISESDLAFLDDETARGTYASRSAVIQHAVRFLREQRMADAYAAAFVEWEESPDARNWDATLADGVA